MSVLPILTWPDAQLSQVCVPVADPTQIANLVSDMFDTMYDAPGRGLAAPQIGVMQRVFVMDPTWKDGDKSPCVCINPQIIWSSETTNESTEACLSIPGLSTKVTRPEAVTLAYMGLDGVRYQRDLTGFAARCVQHELDHLDGLVIFDRLPAVLRATVEAEYAALV